MGNCFWSKRRIITSWVGWINSHLTVITLHGNSSTVDFFPGLDQHPKEIWWNTFTLQHDFSVCLSVLLSLSLSHPPLSLQLSYPLSLSPSLYPTQISAFHCCLPPTCFLATELTCPLFSAPWICRCNPRFYGITYINHHSPRVSGVMVVVCRWITLSTSMLLTWFLPYCKFRVVKATVGWWKICCSHQPDRKT